MSCTHDRPALEIPASLNRQLHDFRRRVWTTKSAEAVCAAIFGVVMAYLAVFTLDRWNDTPSWLRLTIFMAGMAGCAVVPYTLHRWIWRHRRLDQLARLVSRRHPSIGDQMLGTIELVRNPAEQSRSRSLCEAAIRQVAAEARKHDFRDSVPRPRHRLWAVLAALPLAAAGVLLATVPAAARNAWARFAMPWLPLDRYTFAAVERLPARMVVPHGEPVPMSVRLKPDSPWQPQSASGRLGHQPRLVSVLNDGQYAFTLPPQVEANWLDLRIGDARRSIWIQPKLRPELSALLATVNLPAYLGRAKPLRKDLRGGVVSLVVGSTIACELSVNRALSHATVDDQPAAVSRATLTSSPLKIDASRKVVFAWQDEFGLAGQQPFTLSINAREDESPTIDCEGIPRNKVVLDSETLHFSARAVDDFGVRAVGIEWQGKHSVETNPSPATGEQLLAAGASDKETLELAGTFCAKSLGIVPQELGLRLYVEDYFPGRKRAYSPIYTLYVLSAEQHFIWLTDQLSKWHRKSLEVRDRELELHHANQQLRLLPAEELEHPDTRRRIAAQSAAERANGRRLAGLVNSGEDLVRQAMRNPEFGVGHLEKWAEMLQILKDISANRMPNVADLLKQSADARPSVAAASQSKPAPTAGQQRKSAGGQASPGKPPPPRAVPQVVDAESSHQPPAKEGEAQPPAAKSSQPKLRLPVTTVAGSGSKKSPPAQTPAEEKLDQAVKAQQDLLAEFEKIADELNKVLANLEGSTLVKRLKAESRRQYQIAGGISELVSAQFGGSHKRPPEPRRRGTKPAEAAAGDAKTSPAAAAPKPKDLSKLELDSSKKLSTIMDDMQGYFERRHYQRFKTVLDEMRSEEVVASLRDLSSDLPKEVGMSLAQCEFWSDTLDRWADNLVDPACSGKCPGCKSKASLPPSIILEAMQILEGEVNLREETRGAQQARAGLEKPVYSARAGKLRDTQEALSERVGKLAVRIGELPDGKAEFAPEIKLLGRVERVMDEAAAILGQPETGPTAIAAETEAIELLLQSKRINPNGGGGGGASPGGGGGGTTNDSALALLGTGFNDKEMREDHGVSQTTGQSGRALPEEFRAGLDEYFLRLEREREKP